jgi:hypothetical protein
MDFDLQEMLGLASSGVSPYELAAKYGKDRTTILHHCRKHGIVCKRAARAKPAPVTATQEEKVPKPPHKYQHIFDEPICRGHTYAEYLEIERARGRKIYTPLTERELMAM